jgi:hypothetical protein
VMMAMLALLILAPSLAASPLARTPSFPAR